MSGARLEQRDYHDQRHRTLILASGEELEVCRDGAGNWFCPRTFAVFTAQLFLAWTPSMDTAGPVTRRFGRDGGTLNEL